MLRRRLYAILFHLTHLNHIRFPMTSVHFIVHQTTGEVRPVEHHRPLEHHVLSTRGKKKEKQLFAVLH